MRHDLSEDRKNPGTLQIRGPSLFNAFKSAIPSYGYTNQSFKNNRSEANLDPRQY
jgi:hypothetical protein